MSWGVSKTNILGLAIVLITGAFLPALCRGQAAVAYGSAASNSTAMTSRAASSMSSRTGALYGTVGQKTTLKAPPPATKNLETVMKENREKLEKESGKGGGVVRVESVPANATISVDGDPVGKAPTDLKLPEGKHTIELNHPRFSTWAMDVTVNPQESTSVTAKLEKKYKSAVTVSFQ